MLNFKRLALALVALTLGLCRGSRATMVEYNRHSIVSLIFSAEVVVTGEIVALHEPEESPEGDQTSWLLSRGTFELEVERWVIGSGPERITVKQFKNWTCAAREVDYAVGQRVMLFARPPKEQGEPYSILGGGGEGELFLVGSDVIVRGFRMHGYPDEWVEFGGGEVRGPRVDLEEWCASVRGFRDVYVWPVPEGRASRFFAADAFDYRKGPEEAEVFGSLSKSARHLFELARDYPALRPERPAVKLKLRGYADLAAELTGVSLGFKVALAELGDLDGDRVSELVLADRPSFIGGWHPGRVWILFPSSDEDHLRAVARDFEGLGGDGRFAGKARFGDALAPVGDLNGDGIPDLAVGVPGGGLGGVGAIWVLFLDRKGGVLDMVELVDTEAFRKALGEPATDLQFGGSLTNLGDLDGDGYPELVVGRASFVSFGELSDMLISLGADGSVRWARGWQYLFRPEGATFRTVYRKTLVGLGDVDGDGIPDMAVGDPSQLDGHAGGVWIVFLARDGSIRREQLISAWSGGLEPLLLSGDELGASLAAPGDVSGDGIPDLLVASNECIRLFALKRDGTLAADKKLLGLRKLDSSWGRLVPSAFVVAQGVVTIAGFQLGALRRISLAELLEQ